MDQAPSARSRSPAQTGKRREKRGKPVDGAARAGERDGDEEQQRQGESEERQRAKKP
jgi:hypothetical protein